MNACLLIINPHKLTEPPFAPTLILEQNDNLVLYSAQWPYAIKCGPLSDLTSDDLHKLPGMRAEDVILLSDIRQLPTDDLHSEVLISYTRTWWLQVVAEQKHRELVAPAT